MIPASSRSDERGIALILAVFALVVIGALIAAVFFTAQLEERSGTNTLSSLQAAEAAQAGIEYATANWSRTWVQQGIGNTTGIAWTELGTTPGYFGDSITQLNDQLVLVRGFGQARNSAGVVQASRTIAMLFKVGPADFGLKAAATVQGVANVGGKDTVSGADLVPSGGAWATLCAGMTTSNQPASRSSSGAVPTSGGNHYVTPVAVIDSASVATSVADANTYVSPLALMADIKLTSASIPASVAPAVSNHLCATGSSNWGDPTYAASGTDGTSHPCASYFPIIYVDASAGTATLPSGTGQGVLVVNGNLRFNSGFKFYGVIVATGTVSATGVGSTGNLYGGLLSLGNATLNGNERFDYSSCAISVAQAGALIGSPLTSRRFIRY